MHKGRKNAKATARQLIEDRRGRHVKVRYYFFVQLIGMVIDYIIIYTMILYNAGVVNLLVLTNHEIRNSKFSGPLQSIL